MWEDIDNEESVTERKGPSFPEIVVTIFLAVFFIFIFLQIVFL